MTDEDFILFIQVLARDAGRKLSYEEAKEIAYTYYNVNKNKVEYVPCVELEFD